MGEMVTNYSNGNKRNLTNKNTKLVYFGTQGGVFHLAGYGMKSEGVTLGTDPKQLFMPPMENLFTEGARMDGAWYQDTVVSKREMDVEFQVEGKTILQFGKRNDWFWSNWSTRKDGTFAACGQNTGWRWMKTRLGGPAEAKWGKDPALIRACDYDVTIVAPHPLWRSFDDRPFWKDDGSHTGTLRLSNPGDLEAYPTFTMPGPGKYWIQDGENGEIINLPAIGWGDTMKVDTNPLRPFIRVYNSSTGFDGKLNWSKMKGKRLRAPVLPGTAARIRVGVSQGSYNSQIMATTTPEYLRPW